METPVTTAPETQPLLPARPRRFWVVAGLAIAILVLADIALSAPEAFPKGTGTVFTLAQGDTASAVAGELRQDGYIRSTLAFDAAVELLGGARHIVPGDYHFPSGESAFGIAAQIVRGKYGIDQVKVTVPEGDDVSEIAALIVAKIPNFDAKAFIADAAPYEGYLFPETYFFYPNVTPDAVVSQMRAMFDTKTAGLFTTNALDGRSEASIVTMASLVEREASGDGDRATIAGILWKRISIGMRLEVDAAPVTYTQAGLPPAPIANPGLLAIQAALDPTETPYLYYLHDKNGSIHYAKTYAEHQANIAKYLK